MKRKLLVLICALMICSLLPLEGMAVRYGDVVRITNRNAVNVRKGPSTSYSVIGEAQPQNLYAYLGTENGWHHIIYTGDVEGYVSASLTTIEPGLVPDYVGYGERVSAIVRVTHGNALNVRSGPGKKYGSIGQAKPGSTYTYLGMDDGWNIIQYSSSQVGYIAANRTEVEVVDVIASATGTVCDVCDGSGDCPTCDGVGAIYSLKRRANVECPTCGGDRFCWSCMGQGTK
ncbi:MAG: hypothetical protein E7319_10210 [Clostridiales bacterium]|nr:hypothetical protein [Clostridiales bacterium]